MARFLYRTNGNWEHDPQRKLSGEERAIWMSALNGNGPNDRLLRISL